MYATTITWVHAVFGFCSHSPRGANNMKNREVSIYKQIKSKTLLPMVVLMGVIIAILAALSTYDLNSAYKEAIVYAKDGFDNNIRTAVETVVGSLKAVHSRYMDGLISEDEAMAASIEVVRDSRYNSAPGMGDDGYFWADLADGTCVVHYNETNVGQMRWTSQDQAGNLFIQNLIVAGNAGGGYSEFYFGKPGDESGSYKKRGYTLKFEPYGWYISTGNYYEDIDATIARIGNQQRTSILLLLGVSLLTAIAGFLFMSKNCDGLLKPVQSISDQIRALSLGDTSAGIMGPVRRNDGIGELQKNIGTLSQIINTQAGVMRAIADGDYSITVDVRSDKDVMNRAINNMIDKTNETLSQINSSSYQIATGSRQIADGAQALAQGSTEQASAIEQLSSSISEINNMAKENSEISAAALGEVQEAGAMMGVCSEQMNDMLAAMRVIDEKSKTIQKTTKVIDDIAFQTNILALNAAVEAARAGQHGKGFAVVAEEVRNLASKSAEAAKETSALLDSSAQSVEEGNAIVVKVNESLHSIAEIAQNNAIKTASIKTNSAAQSEAMEQIAIGIDQVALVIQQNSATAEESAAASEEMSSQSSMLEEMIEQFKLKDGAASYIGLPSSKKKPALSLQ